MDVPMSNEVAIESAKRGDVLEVDLDYFAEHDPGECGCFACKAFREIIAEGAPEPSWSSST